MGLDYVIVCSEPLPPHKLATSGGALRAWNLGRGLQENGKDVVWLIVDVTGKLAGLEGVDNVLIADPGYAVRLIDKLRPQSVIFQGWPVAGFFPRTDTYERIIDFHGPTLLETHYRTPSLVEEFAKVKVYQVSIADKIMASGTRQMAYIYGWMLQAGRNIATGEKIAHVPFGFIPSEYPEIERSYGNETNIVYGGYHLHWQNPVKGINTLLNTMMAFAQSRQRHPGELRYCAGRHPNLTQPDQFVALEERMYSIISDMGDSSFVKNYGVMPHDEMLEIYADSHVAWDLFERNPERELAMSSRTIEYFWMGLPVVHNNYDELAPLIAEYDAGWTVDPEDHMSIRNITWNLFQWPDMRKMSERTRKLALEKFNAIEAAKNIISS